MRLLLHSTHLVILSFGSLSLRTGLIAQSDVLRLTNQLKGFILSDNVEVTCETCFLYVLEDIILVKV